jgi:putative peptidoglycan lipid II flippase
MFGAGAVFDAFRIGFTIPNLTRDLFAEGALSAAFIPIFTQYLSSKPREEARVLANLVATALIMIVGAIVVAGVALSPVLVSIVAPGFKETPGQVRTGGHDDAHHVPFPAAGRVVGRGHGNLERVWPVRGTCHGVDVLQHRLGYRRRVARSMGRAMAWHYAHHGNGLWSRDRRRHSVAIASAEPAQSRIPVRPQFDLSHPGLRQIFMLMGPAILGNAAVQINVTVNNNFASRLEDPHGPVSWLSYAFRFMQLPLGIFGVAVASATLPSISRSAAAENFDEFRQTLSRSLGLVFVLTIPSAVGLALLGEAMVGAVYQMGEFTAADTRQTARALACYAVGLVGYSAAKVLNPAFYALRDAHTPMYVSLGSIAVNIAMVVSLLNVAGFGHEGLALSTSLVAVFTSVALFTIMRNRVGGIYGRRLWSTFVRVSLASALMGIVVWAANRYIGAPLGTTKLARLANLAITIPLGFGVLYTACRMLHVTELDDAIRGLAGPLQRVFPFLRARIPKQ